MSAMISSIRSAVLLDLAGLVDDDVVVVVLSGELDRRVPLAQLELVGGLGRPRPQPPEQRLDRRRDDEDEERLVDPLLHVLGALDVDLEDDVAPGERAPRGPPSRGRPVPVAVDLVRLEQAAGIAQREEALAVEEVVAHAVDLARPRRPRRAGHDVVAVRVDGGDAASPR